jgi:CheY-like chemotaxis protein
VDTILELQQLGNPIPIVAISGGRRAVSAQFNLESARLLGVKAGLVKPFSRADLRGALAEVMA